MRKVLCVGRDAAPSGCFRALKPVLESRDCEVILAVGDGKPFELDPLLAVNIRQFDLVFLGMSSSSELAAPEIAIAAAAKAAGVKYGFYGDTPGCYNRALSSGWFGPYAFDASFYLSVTEEDARDSRCVFQSALHFGTGNPLREAMAFPPFSRAHIRGLLGLANDEKLIVVPGGKIAGFNMTLLTFVMEAMRRLHPEWKTKLVFAPHPGDEVYTAVGGKNQQALLVYGELLQLGSQDDNARVVDAVGLTNPSMKTEHLIPGADLFIEYGSTIAIGAAYMRCPIITVDTKMMSARTQKLTGHRLTEAAREGISVMVGMSLPELVETMNALLSDSPSRTGLIQRQTDAYPRPTKPNQALELLADAIGALLNPKK